MNTSNRSDSEDAFDPILTSTQIDDCNETPAISSPTSGRRLRITVTLRKNDPNSLSEASFNHSFSFASTSQDVSCQTDFCRANKRKRSEVDSKVERFKYGETADASTLHRQAGVNTIKEKTENRSKEEKCDKNCDTVSTLASVEPQEFTNDNLGDKLVSRKKKKKTEQEQNKTEAFTKDKVEWELICRKNLEKFKHKDETTVKSKKKQVVDSTNLTEKPSETFSALNALKCNVRKENDVKKRKISKLYDSFFEEEKNLSQTMDKFLREKREKREKKSKQSQQGSVQHSILHEVVDANGDSPSQQFSTLLDILKKSKRKLDNSNEDEELPNQSLEREANTILHSSHSFEKDAINRVLLCNRNTTDLQSTKKNKKPKDLSKNQSKTFEESDAELQQTEKMNTNLDNSTKKRKNKSIVQSFEQSNNELSLLPEELHSDKKKSKCWNKIQSKADLIFDAQTQQIERINPNFDDLTKSKKKNKTRKQALNQANINQFFAKTSNYVRIKELGQDEFSNREKLSKQRKKKSRHTENEEHNELENSSEQEEQNNNQKVNETMDSSFNTSPSFTSLDSPERKQLKATNADSDDSFDMLLRTLTITMPLKIPMIHRIETRMSAAPTKVQQRKLKRLNVKTGRFSEKEDQIIRDNWKLFCEVHGISSDPKPFLTFSHSGRMLPKSDRIKFVQYLGKGLNTRPLNCIYRRFKLLYQNCKKGCFSKEEDETILEVMNASKSKNKFLEIGRELNRPRYSVKRCWERLCQNKKFQSPERLENGDGHRKRTKKTNKKQTKHLQEGPSHNLTFSEVVNANEESPHQSSPLFDVLKKSKNKSDKLNKNKAMEEHANVSPEVPHYSHSLEKDAINNGILLCNENTTDLHLLGPPKKKPKKLSESQSETLDESNAELQHTEKFDPNLEHSTKKRKNKNIVQSFEQSNELSLLPEELHSNKKKSKCWNKSQRKVDLESDAQTQQIETSFDDSTKSKKKKKKKSRDNCETSEIVTDTDVNMSSTNDLNYASQKKKKKSHSVNSELLQNQKSDNSLSKEQSNQLKLVENQDINDLLELNYSDESSQFKMSQLTKKKKLKQVDISHFFGKKSDNLRTKGLEEDEFGNAEKSSKQKKKKSGHTENEKSSEQDKQNDEHKVDDSMEALFNTSKGLGQDQSSNTEKSSKQKKKKSRHTENEDKQNDDHKVDDNMEALFNTSKGLGQDQSSNTEKSSKQKKKKSRHTENEDKQNDDHKVDNSMEALFNTSKGLGQDQASNTEKSSKQKKKKSRHTENEDKQNDDHKVDDSMEALFNTSKGLGQDQSSNTEKSSKQKKKKSRHTENEDKQNDDHKVDNSMEALFNTSKGLGQDQSSNTEKSSKQKKKKSRHTENEDKQNDDHKEDNSMEALFNTSIVLGQDQTSNTEKSSKQKKKKSRHTENEDKQNDDHKEDDSMEALFNTSIGLGQDQSSNTEKSSKQKKKKSRHTENEDKQNDDHKVHDSMEALFNTSKGLGQDQSSNTEKSSKQKKKKSRHTENEGKQNDDHKVDDSMEALFNTSKGLGQDQSSNTEKSSKQKKKKSRHTENEDKQNDKHKVNDSMESLCHANTPKRKQLNHSNDLNESQELEHNKSLQEKATKKKTKSTSTIKDEEESEDSSLLDFADSSFAKNSSNIMFKGLTIITPWEVSPAHLIETRMSSTPTKAQREKFEKLPFKLKIGKFSEQEDQIIKNNWNRFCEAYRIQSDPQPFLNLGTALDQQDRINFVRYLAKGIENRMLNRIYCRFQTLYRNCKEGCFSKEEDEAILEIMNVSRSNHKFVEIGNELNRSRFSIERRFQKLVQYQKFQLHEKLEHSHGAQKRPQWSIERIQEFLTVLQEVTLTADIDELRNREILKEEWETISLQLNCSVEQLKVLWNFKVYPQLFIECPLSGKEMVELIVRRLHKSDVTWKTADWKAIAEKVTGLTALRVYRCFKNFVKDKVPKELHGNLKDCVNYLMTNYVKVDATGAFKMIKKFKFEDGNLTVIDK